MWFYPCVRALLAVLTAGMVAAACADEPAPDGTPRATPAEPDRSAVPEVKRTEEPPTPTPIPPSGPACPVDEDACLAAIRVAAGLATGYADLARDARPLVAACPDPDRPLLSMSPVCDGAKGGEVRTGFSIASKTFRFVDDTTFASEVRRILALGNGQAKHAMLSIRCQRAAASDCSRTFTVALRVSDMGVDRTAILIFQNDASGPALVGIRDGLAVDSRAAEGGGVAEIGHQGIDALPTHVWLEPRLAPAGP